MDPIVIGFVDYNNKDLGDVTYRDGQLEGTTTSRQNVIDDWLSAGGTAETFVNYYKQWTNGFVTSYLDNGPDGDPNDLPPDFPVPAGYAGPGADAGTDADAAPVDPTTAD
jgi:hypothetical protein